MFYLISTIFKVWQEEPVETLAKYTPEATWEASHTTYWLPAS